MERPIRAPLPPNKTPPKKAGTGNWSVLGPSLAKSPDKNSSTELQDPTQAGRDDGVRPRTPPLATAANGRLPESQLEAAITARGALIHARGCSWRFSPRNVPKKETRKKSYYAPRMRGRARGKGGIFGGGRQCARSSCGEGKKGTELPPTHGFFSRGERIKDGGRESGRFLG